jgi:hypothetical protein
MINYKNKSSIKRTVKALTLGSSLLFQGISFSAEAQEFDFGQQLTNPFAKNLSTTQFEIGIKIPLGKSGRSQQSEKSNFYVSYFLPGQDQHIGIGFTRSFGRNANYQYLTRFRDMENEVDMSLPFYASPTLNASSTGSSFGIGTYSVAIGIGLLLLAAAGGGGGDEEAPQINTTSTRAERVTRRFEEIQNLPMCSPIPPADGNEPPCRTF